MSNFPGSMIIKRGFVPNSLAGLQLWLDANSDYVSSGGSRQFTSANNEYFTINDNSSLDFGDIDFWMSCWFYCDTVINASLIGKYASSKLEFLVSLLSTGAVKFEVSDDGSTSSANATTVTGLIVANQWNFILAWHDSINNTINLRVNNDTTISTSHITGVNKNDSPFTIGVESGGSNYFNGRMALTCIGKNPISGISSQISDIHSTLFNTGRAAIYGDLSTLNKTNWGLISFWGLNENSGNAIDEHGSNNLTDTNSVTVANGPGQGFSRDFELSNSEYFQITDHVDLRTGDIDWEINLWVKLESKGTHQIFLSKYIHTSLTHSEFKIEYRFTIDRLRLTLIKSSISYDVDANNYGSVPLDTWINLSVWHDSVNNEIGIRVNDTSENLESHTIASNSSTQPVLVGRQGGSPSLNFDGQQCRIGRWNRLLTSAERTQLYNSGEGLVYSDLDSSLLVDLIGWWDSIENSGNLIDSHASHDGIDVNSVTRGSGPSNDYFENIQDGDVVQIWQSKINNYLFSQTNAAAKPTWKNSIINGYPVIRFDGTDDFLELIQELFTNSSGSLVAFVIKSAGTTGNRTIISTSNTSSDTAYSRSHVTSTNDKAAIAVHTGTLDEVEAGSALGTDDFYVITIYSDTSNFTININGSDGSKTVLNGADSGDPIGVPSSKTSTLIGALETLSAGVSDFFDGDLAELIIYEGTYTLYERSQVINYLRGKYGI